MKLFKGKDNYFKTFILGLMFSCLLFVLTFVLFFFNLKEVPLGILLGGIYSSLYFILLSKLEKKSIKATIVVLIIKFVLFAGIMVLVGFMYYVWEIKLFNLFALAGGYSIPGIIYFILISKEKHEDINIAWF